MKIACDACGAKYTIADDKVRGRKVKIRCKSCGTPIVVNGQQGAGTGSVPDAETEAALEPLEALIWSVNLSETDSRSMSVQEIVLAYTSGIVTADAFVWKDGMADWVPLLESELAPLLRSAKPAVTARARASRPAAARLQTAQENNHDLFGAIEIAGADENLATSAPAVPQAGTSAYDDGKLTGARNENSVLFSLDALKAGFSPSASGGKPLAKTTPGPKGSRSPSPAAQDDDPFGMGASAGAGGVLFGDNRALLTAPAPPPAPTPAPAPAHTASTQVAPAPSNKWVLILGSIAVLTIVGLLAALLLGRNHDAASSAEGSVAPSASVGSEASAQPAVEAKKSDEAAPKAEDKPADSASATASGSAAPSASVASANASPTSNSATRSAPPKSDGALATTKSVAPKKPKEEPPPPEDAPPFSKASAISALSAAASSASSCKKAGSPTGSGKATITFAPSGRVTTATVAGPLAGTAVGGCVASVFRRSHVPAFSGSSVTVSKSFNIN